MTKEFFKDLNETNLEMTNETSFLKITKQSMF